MMRGSGAVNLIVTCTQAKRVAPVVSASRPRLDLSLPVAARAAQWAKALASVPGEGGGISDLYGGDHWSVACGLHDPSGSPPVRLWVASAGYGLVGMQSRVHSYGATFRGGEPDSVICSMEEAPDWWEALPQHVHLADADAPRTIEQLVDQDRGAALMVVASRTYLAAMGRDLERALMRMKDQRRALVVTAGADPGNTPLAEVSLRFDARIQSVVGGGMPSLNVRVARHVIRECGFPSVERSEVQAALDRHCEGLPEFSYPQREKSKDLQVLEFIRGEIEADARCTKSRLLRAWRDSGRACEQKRFGRLFDSVKMEFHA